MRYSDGMTGWRRWLLLCLLGLALPLQGMAAAAQWHCHGGPAAPAPDTDPAEHAGHADHADHHAHAGPSGDAVEPPGSDDATSYADGAGRCSACASCCIAAALPAQAWGPLAAAPPAPFKPAGGHARPPAFETDGPERPPRIRLA